MPKHAFRLESAANWKTSPKVGQINESSSEKQPYCILVIQSCLCLTETVFKENTIIRYKHKKISIWW